MKATTTGAVPPRTHIARAVAMIVAFGAAACGNSTSAPAMDPGFELPTTEFAARLGLVAPVSSEEAERIAVEATGGTVLGVSEETENGELIFEVRVETDTERLEVEVRASDGAITEIEPDDG